MSLNPPVTPVNRFPRSPLALVVCQIQCEDLPAMATSQVMLAIHQSLGGRRGPYPIAEQVNLNRLNIHISGPVPQPPATTVTKGWRLRSEDRRWAITLLPDHVALETTNYTTWEEDFRTRISALLDALTSQGRPTIEQRLGLRYINRIADPGVATPTQLREYIAPELLGMVLHQSLGEMVKGAQQQIELEAGEGIQVVMRHGFSRDEDRDGALAYLLDFDIFRQGIQAFDVADIRSSLDRFHGLALRLFQQSLTEKMLAYLQESDATIDR